MAKSMSGDELLSLIVAVDGGGSTTIYFWNRKPVNL